MSLRSANSQDNLIIKMEGITKRFPGVVANDDVHLEVEQGTFHALIGENGAGKSTLLNLLYGKYRPEIGTIRVKGKDVTTSLRSPSDAIALGIGLVSQHYALIPALTLLENVMLGAEPTHSGGILNYKRASERVNEIAHQLGLGELDLNTRAGQLSVALQQKVEILKTLYRGVDILMLDEPTATLAPQETDALFSLLQTLSSNGTTILFVTHKLREVMRYSHAITVLRRGKSAGDFVTSETNEQELLTAMIGTQTAALHPSLVPEQSGQNEPLHSKLTFNRTPKEVNSSNAPLLTLEILTVKNSRGVEAVEKVSLEVRRGEILGVAGVDGSGQRELSQALVGLLKPESGRITFDGEDITRLSVKNRQHKGIAYLPEDRHKNAVVMDFTVSENYLLGHQAEANWGGGILLKPKTALNRTVDILKRYDVRTATGGASLPIRTLSGGNQQKVVFARAMESQPKLLIACQPTRGLDVEASRFVYETLRTARDNGLGILLFTLDLDEALQLSDRIAVMFNRKIVAVLSREEATMARVGALMTGAVDGETNGEKNKPVQEENKGE